MELKLLEFYGSTEVVVWKQCGLHSQCRRHGKQKNVSTHSGNGNMACIQHLIASLYDIPGCCFVHDVLKYAIVHWNTELLIFTACIGAWIDL